MTKLQRIKSIVTGVIMIATAILLIQMPSDGYLVILAILSVGMVVSGTGTLIYYFSMARFMVGGRRMLYKGILLLDFGFFTMSLSDIPRFYILLYLLGIHAFSGFVEVLRAREAKGYGSGVWKGKLFHGLLDIAMAVACVTFIRQPGTAVIIYSLGLIYSALLRIVSAFQKTKMIYIQ
ncbi:MAG: DUF308 domain-containing protein [Lachnospiraceae bacterium]|nr:DUF308 domain-containing protein [Lachnospiraceae bacterium]